MFDPVLDHHEAIRALREVVVGNERFRYYVPPVDGFFGGCVYMHEGKPSCLIGKALKHFCPTVKFLNNRAIYFLDDYRPDPADIVKGIVITPEAHKILGVAQRHQDDASTWGEALDAAEEEYLKHCG